MRENGIFYLKTIENTLSEGGGDLQIHNFFGIFNLSIFLRIKKQKRCPTLKFELTLRLTLLKHY